MFSITTGTMVPVYALLLAAGKAPAVFAAVTSHLVPVALAGFWLFGLNAGVEVSQASVYDFLMNIARAFLSGGNALCQMFAEKWFTAVAWTHLLMLDFVLAREIAIDARRLDITCVHSLVLCFMCGPVGYLSHMLTKRILGKAGA